MFTEQAREAIVRAQDEAREMGHGTVQIEHFWSQLGGARMLAKLGGTVCTRRGRLRGLAAAIAACLACAGALNEAALAAPSPGAGGAASAFVRHIVWTVRFPARGVELLSGTFSDPRVHPSWTVTIESPTVSPFDATPEYAEAGSPAWARQTAAQLEADGFSSRAERVDWPRYLGDPRGLLGVRVRVGEFATPAAAAVAAVGLVADGFHPLVEWEGFDPQQPPDAELLHVAIIDPRRFAGRVVAYHDTAVASRGTVAQHSRQLGALAAVNGGFFTIAPSLSAVAGVPTGLGIYAGRLQALANGERADLVLDARRPAQIENLHATAWLIAGGRRASIRGVNRLPGSAEDCGVPGFRPTSAPRQGVVCTGASDLVLFTPAFGAPLPSGPGIQVVLDHRDRVLSLGARGGALPAGDSALQAIGAATRWVTAHLRVGRRVDVRVQVRRANGRPMALGPRVSAVSAAPVLLRDGRPAIDAVSEGVFDPRDLYDYGFSAERHARTMAGIDRRGRLLLVTADGIPGISEGLTLTEEAMLMRSLGCLDAMNLDGGGSTSFVVNGQTINHPSDPTGPRPIGDSIQIVP